MLFREIFVFILRLVQDTNAFSGQNAEYLNVEGRCAYSLAIFYRVD
jgi:hypothetical protein